MPTSYLHAIYSSRAANEGHQPNLLHLRHCCRKLRFGSCAIRKSRGLAEQVSVLQGKLGLCGLGVAEFWVATAEGTPLVDRRIGPVRASVYTPSRVSGCHEVRRYS